MGPSAAWFYEGQLRPHRNWNWCPRGAQTCARPFLPPWPWPNELQTGSGHGYSKDIFPHRKRSCYVKPFESYSLNKYEDSSQGQRSRSNVTNFQTPLAFTMGHIFTTLHQLWSVAFVIMCGQPQRQTDTQTLPKTTLARSVRAGDNVMRQQVTYICVFI